MNNRTLYFLKNIYLRKKLNSNISKFLDNYENLEVRDILQDTLKSQRSYLIMKTMYGDFYILCKSKSIGYLKNILYIN